jgi:5-methyltetrahydropteroyltriglutamate--homocysteine methyltransferase
MRRSTERILTTHVGSLVRTREIIEAMKARALGLPYDDGVYQEDLRRGVAEVVRKQVEVGIDIPSDGEYGRPGFSSYVNECLAGLQQRPREPGDWVWPSGTTRGQFPEFFAQYNEHYRKIWMLPEVSIDELPNLPGTYERFRVVGPIRYKGQEFIQRQIDNFRDALSGLDVVDAFIPAVTPLRRGDRDILEHYPSERAFLYDVADAMHEEYKAIVDAGFVLQVDFAALQRFNILQQKPDATQDDIDAQIESQIEIVNHALQGIPEERVRYHHCWGSMNDPHTGDVPLREFVHLMFKIKAQAYSLEAANPRHEHEWMVWKDVKLPEGKILIPGLISQSTNVVEHPELVAWRIENFASVVGKENVIAGADCGFSQFWDAIRVHPSVQWAKLKSLADGARLASEKLWKN